MLRRTTEAFTAVVALVGAVVTLGFGSTAIASPVAPSAAALPSLSMAAAEKAAQIDPRRADDTLTPGAKASVQLVEQALTWEEYQRAH